MPGSALTLCWLWIRTMGLHPSEVSQNLINILTKACNLTSSRSLATNKSGNWIPHGQFSCKRERCGKVIVTSSSCTDQIGAEQAHSTWLSPPFQHPCPPVLCLKGLGRQGQARCQSQVILGAVSKERQDPEAPSS